MAPHRLGRAAFAIGLGALVVLATFFATAPTDDAADNLGLAPVPVDEQEAVVVEPAARPAPTLAPTRVPTNDTQFERVLRPLLVEAKHRRQAAAAEDPAY